MKRPLISGILRLLFCLGLLACALHAQGQFVTLTGTLQASNGLPAVNETISFVPSQWGFIGGTGVVVNVPTYCATSTDGTVVGITNPLQPTTNTAAYSGGTLAAANYFVQYAWYTSTGTVTLVSPESTAQLTAQGNLAIALPSGPLPAGVMGWVVAIGTSSGGERFQGIVVGNGVYTQSTPLVLTVPGSPTVLTPTALDIGSPLPVANTTVCKQVANDAIWPVGTGYTVAITDPSGNTLPGYPMVWQLLGPNTTINLSNGLPYYHGIVTFPVPVLASPLNHATQSISGGLSLGAYPMWAGSFGVNVVTPAWGVDVEGAGAKSRINANGGYLANGGGGTAGQVLSSDGTAYDTPILPLLAAQVTAQANSGVSITQTSPGVAVGSTIISTGAGVPSGACNTPLYINTTPTNVSTVLYVCYSGTWTAVSVP